MDKTKAASIGHQGVLRSAIGSVILAFLLLGFGAQSLAASITLLSGSNQSGAINTTLPAPLAVAVDCTGLSFVPIPPPCGTVTWTSSDSTDSFSPNPSNTAGTGTVSQSSTTLTLGSTPGVRTVTATTPLLPTGQNSVSFTITAVTAVASSVTIISGNNQTGTVNAPLASPFVVTVTQGGSPAPDGTVVTWEVASGGGRLSAGGTTTTTNGQTSNTLILGPNAGAQTVIATVAGGASVTFTVNGGTLSTTPGLSQPAQAVAVALDSACAASTSGPLNALCNQIAQLSDNDKRSALQQLAPTQISTQGTGALQAQTVQTSNIDARIVALRAGATGFSLNGLSLNVAGKTLPLMAFASVAPPGESGASAAEPPGFSRLGAFLNGQIGFGDQDATSREPGFDVRTQGITGGIDYRVTDRFILGGALGYVRNKSDFQLSAGDLTTRGYTLSAFGTYYVAEEFYVDGIVTYGRNNYDTKRNIVFPGFSASAAGDTDSAQRAMGLSAGYNFHRGGLTFGPYARVNYIRVDVDGFEEKDAGAASLRIDSQRITSFTTNLGAQWSYAIGRSWGVLLPNARLDWEHQHRNGSRLVSATFLADPVQTVFAIPTNDPDRDYFNLALGLSATFKAGRTAFLNYETVLGRSGVTNYLLTAGVRIEF